MKNGLNDNVMLRDIIIFGKYDPDNYMGGICRFKISLDTLQELVDNNFIDLDECQNGSPSAQEFLTYMRKWNGYYAHGYTVDIVRDDYRITLEGIGKDTPADSQEELDAFMELCKDADELSHKDELYAWWD